MSEPTPQLETQAGDDLLAELADDFLRRYRAGEHPSVKEYATKHPELADRIRDLFPAVIVMERPDAGATLDFAPPTERVGATIGRYKLLEKIGKCAAASAPSSDSSGAHRLLVRRPFHADADRIVQGSRRAA